jgi:hypothetical protein
VLILKQRLSPLSSRFSFSYNSAYAWFIALNIIQFFTRMLNSMSGALDKKRLWNQNMKSEYGFLSVCSTTDFMSESQDSPCNLIAPQAVKAGAPSGEIQRFYQLMETEDNKNGDFFYHTAQNALLLCWIHCSNMIQWWSTSVCHPLMVRQCRLKHCFSSEAENWITCSAQDSSATASMLAPKIGLN